MWNSPEESSEKDDIYLDTYDFFLVYIETVIWEELDDSVKMKNTNNYKMLLKWNNENNFLVELFKKFEIVKHARVWFIDNAVKDMKERIKAGEIYLIPIFTYNDDKKWLFAESLFFVKKKDKIAPIKEKVKRIIDFILPSPEPEFCY